MDTAKIKSYAPKARKAFIEAITRQAALLGITEQSISPVEIKGDIALIDGKPHPAAIGKRRIGLEQQIKQQGYQPVIEKIAYSWFNRFVALRYMELHNYLGHGRRVLSHPEQDNAFQILEECTDIDMEGLDKNKVIQLKLAGDKDEALYRLLLLAQCHQLHNAMVFLFEAVDDASELLLPNNLTKTDSLIRQLVSDIPEELWKNVEIIGWLYQFYISEKKDQVIGKVVKSEDIPAATQLFTPNWIVKYLVQNSIGRQWMMTYPDSPLKAQMEYYIEPAEQTDEVQAQLKTITPESIDPQTIKVLDPACGSGHILVEAYDLLKAIYIERGYRSRDIPQLILENNLYGLDIDDRAAQLAGFALLMKARADDRRIFTRNIHLNVLSLQSSQHLNPIQLWNDLNLHGQWQKQQTEEMFAEVQGELSAPENDVEYQLIVDLVERFQQAKTFGSLIDVPNERLAAIETLYKNLRELSQTGDTRQKPATLVLLPILHQALMLSQRYDAVVANPPYMGSKGMNIILSKWAKLEFPNCWDRGVSDLYAMFIEQAIKLSLENGSVAMITMQGWMFSSSFETLRTALLDKNNFSSLIHLGTKAFDSIAGQVVSTVAFVFKVRSIDNLRSHFFRLLGGKNETAKKQMFTSNNQIINSKCKFLISDVIFKQIPGFPISYWITNRQLENFNKYPLLSNAAKFKAGLSTGDNTKFQRLWHEINIKNMVVGGKSAKDIKDQRWVPCNSGGSYRKWYGNNEVVINWADNGAAIKNYKGSAIRNENEYFKSGLTYNKISSGRFACRVKDNGFIFDDTGRAIVCNEEDVDYLQAFLSSIVAHTYLGVLAPTLSFTSKELSRVPFHESSIDAAIINSKRLVYLSRSDWDSYETSWNFKSLGVVKEVFSQSKLKTAYKKLLDHWKEVAMEVKRLEEDNNSAFIEAYSLQEELRSDVSLSEITLTCNPYYRYGSGRSKKDLDNLLQTDTFRELLSYTVGNMMGRYSLDREGLIYAHAANEGFAELVAEEAYKTFPADDDGIIPLTDQEWFDDDATNRFRDFVEIVWGEEQLQENLAFVAESLCLHAIKPKRGEASLETIRRYLATKFYKDHLKTYKKRPIYWLFSSGKQKAFECLVYLHRYNAGTLARMRTEYVIPLTSKLNSHVEKLEQDKESSESAVEVKKIEKELQALHKKQAELSTFDEKLRHFSDQRIELDLDDGVKINYGKFGGLLADVKAITGKK